MSHHGAPSQGGYAPAPTGAPPGGYGPPSGHDQQQYAPPPTGAPPGGYAPAPTGAPPGGYGPPSGHDQQQYAPPPTGAPGGYAPPSHQGGIPPSGSLPGGGEPPEKEPPVPASPLPAPDGITPTDEPFHPELTPDGEMMPPPTTYEIPQAEHQAPQQQADELLDTRPFTEEDAREILEQWVKTTWLRKRGLAATTPITGIHASNTYVCILETFVESRKLIPRYRPFQGELIDDARCGPVPGAWDVVMPPQQLFVSTTKAVTLPHTEAVRICHGCNGRGDERCHSCHGRGENRCSSCHGSGYRKLSRMVDGRTEHYEERCAFCHHGYSRCSFCSGRGWITCSICDGYRTLVHYILLEVSWKNNLIRDIVEARDAAGPDMDESSSLLTSGAGAVASAEGPLVHAEENVMLQTVDPSNPHGVRVNPEVTTATNIALNKASKHGALQHRQRLTVRGVPCYKVGYVAGSTGKNFWVLGTNRKVHAPGFPASPLRVLALIMFILFIIALICGGIFAIYWFMFME